MFRLLHGVSEEEWRNNPAVRFTAPPYSPELDGSDDEGTSVEGGEDEASASQWATWCSGACARDAAVNAGKWPDGSPIGRGHGSPYLPDAFHSAFDFRHYATD